MDTRTLCLGVLNRGDATGYEIKKSFEEGPLAHIHEASFGAIYPALTKLAEEGLVAYRAEPQSQRADTRSKRPDKKHYSITRSGEAALEAALVRQPRRDEVRSDFLFILFFAHRLSPAELTRLIDARIAGYDEILERMQACDRLAERPAGERFVHEFGLAVYQRARAFLADNRDRLLAEAAADAAPTAAGRVAAAK